jgi:hypothetical protein
MVSQTVSLGLLKLGLATPQEILKCGCIHAQLWQISKLMRLNGGVLKRNTAAVAK